MNIYFVELSPEEWIVTSSGKSAPIRLRGSSIDDAFAVTRLLEGDSELALQTATIPIPYTIEAARAFLTQADPREIFGVLAGEDLVGMIGMVGDHDPVEIGYWIGRRHWGKGFATSAVGLIVQEAQRRGIARLVAEVFPSNAASMRVLEKCGFARQGSVYKDLPERGGLRELIRYQRELQT